VDRHKKMHRELMATVSREFNGVLKNPIPFLSQIEKMGIYREPVAAFSPGSTASESYQKLWDNIQETILNTYKREK
ncbi:MAG: ParA family protein, partial [Planctomycetota bacterium]